MKTYVIASEEYEANMPDLFLMDEKGKYYGASKHSYPVLRNFPKDPKYWMNATSSDDDRKFNVTIVELDEEKVKEFEHVTQEYYEFEANIPKFEECPLPSDFDTTKEFNAAVSDWEVRRRKFWKENNMLEKVSELAKIWSHRTSLFCSFARR